MRKILLVCILFFLAILNVSAISSPNNIYYLNDGIYAYLENNNIELTDNQKLFIEYRLKKGEEIETLDLIEVNKNQNIIFLTDKIDEIDDLIIESRFAVLEDDYNYSEWSEGVMTKFDFIDKPVPKIANLKFDQKFTYEIINQEEINYYFEKYKKIYNLDINYIEEYEVNDNYQKEIPDDLSDIKLNFRIHYEIGSIKSDYSNILLYENHPEKCVFDSTFCCNQILNISVCIWIFIISFLLILTLILIDKKMRKKREA